MKTTRTIVLLTGACLFMLAGGSGSASATSVFFNTVETESYSNDPFNQNSPPPALIQPFNNGAVPWTMFHPNPIHGFASSQGVSALFGDGTGFAVHAQVDLVPGSRFTRSTARAAVEFEIVDPSTHLAAPVDVSFLGKYLTGSFGGVRVHLWRGLANSRGSSGNPPQLMFFAGNTADPDVGIWSVERTLMTRTVYSLELEAVAGAFDGFNASSFAFIDPVISFDGGPGVELGIQFDTAATLENPNFIAPPVPEPTPLVLGGSLALGWLARSSRRSRA